MIQRTITNVLARREKKTCLRGLRPSETLASLLSYRHQLGNLNFASSQFRYFTHHRANDKGADQTVRMRATKSVFSHRGPLYFRSVCCQTSGG